VKTDGFYFKGYKQVQKNPCPPALEMEKKENAPREKKEKILKKKGKTVVQFCIVLGIFSIKLATWSIFRQSGKAIKG